MTVNTRQYRVIVEPHVSEKASFIAEQSNRQICFKVLPSATKLEIKNAVEDLFKVKVDQVNTVQYQGKQKRFKQRLGVRNKWKKAYVTLGEGFDIDFARSKCIGIKKMAIVKAKPTSAGRRFVVKVVNPDLHKGRPHEPLVTSLSKTGGRNNAGRITTRHRGGGHKRLYRKIDFKRNKDGIPAKVERLEYDPNRTAYIALLLYADGERRYIIAPKGLKKGDAIQSGAESPIKPGCALALTNIPVGTIVHAIELDPGRGAKMARSAGTYAQIVAKEGAHTTLRLRSGEMRKVLSVCRATVGEVSNSEHNLRSLGKAGASRWRGRRPTVRGVAMNPVDHPHGGGEGRTSGGRHPVTPWGKPTKGAKTRKSTRSDKLIVRRRNKRNKK